MKVFTKILSFLLAAIIAAAAIIPCLAVENIEFLQYPDGAVTEFRDEILNRISTGDDYLANRGYDETSLYISPYWTMRANGRDIPVYATAVYDWVLDRGVVQSFQYIFVDGNAELNIEMQFCRGAIKNAVILPEKLNTKATVNGDRISARITSAGDYTVLINDDSQEYAVTLFVRENRNEDAEIAAYREKYGDENVAVYDSGIYELDSVPADRDVLYFRRGSFILFNHKTDIRTDEDAQNADSASVFSVYGKKSAVITGCGTFDFTRVDRRERNLITVNYCTDTAVDGLILLNPNSWTVTAYACENCTFRDITVFGYRTNSDGINICGCSSICVENSFCRNGDDCFSVKATNADYECHDISFENCIGWSNKARCFGITGEVERDIYNIHFSDCAVIYRNAVWDLDRTASLVIAVETGGCDVYNVVFENIEIHKDTGRPIYCMVYGEGLSDCQISGIVFRNIKINADEKIKISSQRGIDFIGRICASIFRFLNKPLFKKMKLFGKLSEVFGKRFESTNSVSVLFENVTVNGSLLKRAGNRFFIKEGNFELSFLK